MDSPTGAVNGFRIGIFCRVEVSYFASYFYWVIVSVKATDRAGNTAEDFVRVKSLGGEEKTGVWSLSGSDRQSPDVDSFESCVGSGTYPSTVVYQIKFCVGTKKAHDSSKAISIYIDNEPLAEKIETPAIDDYYCTQYITLSPTRRIDEVRFIDPTGENMDHIGAFRI